MMNKKEIKTYKKETKAAVKKAGISYTKKSPAERKEIDERAARSMEKGRYEIGDIGKVRYRRKL